MKYGQSGAAGGGGNQGWADWPMVYTTVGGDGVPKQSTTMPASGFNKIIRCSYWMNAYNPIGSAPNAPYSMTDIYYSTIVGFGNAAYGYLQPHRTTDIRRSSDLVAVADGLYAGRQGSSRQDPATIPAASFTCRVAYRHPGIAGKNSACNAGFADGHVERLGRTNFPVPVNGNLTHDQNMQLILSSTIYADPNGITSPN